MLNKAVISLTLLGALSLSDLALGRMHWPEREGRAVFLNPRRFGQQNPPITQEFSQACPSGTGTCAQLGGSAISTLLANAGSCTQQDAADGMISELLLPVEYIFSLTSRLDAAKQFDAATQQKMINLAVQFRQAEKNTPPVCMFC
jgi:hypothetical protein